MSAPESEKIADGPLFLDETLTGKKYQEVFETHIDPLITRK